MPRSKVPIIAFNFKEEKWLEAGGRHQHVQAPSWDALPAPFLQGFGPEDDDTRINDFVREAIRYYATNNNVTSEYFNIYHVSINGFGVRRDAKCCELCHMEEVTVYYEMPN